MIYTYLFQTQKSLMCLRKRSKIIRLKNHLMLGERKGNTPKKRSKVVLNFGMNAFVLTTETLDNTMCDRR